MSIAYVKLFLDWREETAYLTDDEKGRLIDAVVAYAGGEENPEAGLTGNERVLFPVFRLKIDRDNAAYSEKVASGKKGGVAKASNAKQKLATSSEASEPYQEKEKENLSCAPDGAECDSLSPNSGEKAKKEYPTGFEEFWGAYPRKTGKAEAYKCYAARLKDGWSPDELLQAARTYAQETARRHTEPQYIKHAKTFLSADTPFTDFLPGRGVPEQQRLDEEDPFADWRQ